MYVGLKGEFRCVIRDANGDTKSDTGYQENLILDEGLNTLGLDNTAIGNDCAIGSGNSTPTVTQTKLDAFAAITRYDYTAVKSNYAYTDYGDNTYRIWEERLYRFTGLNNVNVTEVGLVANGNTSSNYVLATRALIKDATGSPTSITIRTGETLDVYYRVHRVTSTADLTYVINLLDGAGGSVPYNVVSRPAFVGNSEKNTVFSSIPVSWYTGVGFGNLVAITNAPDIPSFDAGLVKYPYVNGSFKRLFTVTIGLSEALGNINLINSGSGASSFNFCPFQMMVTKVSDGSPMVKTNKEILELPFEVSWGRYEGVL